MKYSAILITMIALCHGAFAQASSLKAQSEPEQSMLKIQREAVAVSTRDIMQVCEWKVGEDLTREWSITALIKPLNNILARNFPAYSTAIPDVARAQIFIADVKKWEREGKMLNLVLLQLPSNHTNGASPGAHTPKAMVADNDLALRPRRVHMNLTGLFTHTFTLFP